MGRAVKLSDELVESARHESNIYSRSMTQQIEHWARIGRAIERSGAVSHDRVRSALVAELAFDELGTEERAVVLGALERKVFRPRGDAGLAAELREGGEPRSGVGPDGCLVAYGAAGDGAPIDDVEAYARARKGRASDR